MKNVPDGLPIIGRSCKLNLCTVPKDAERQIDLLITEAYGLSQDEARIVCPRLKSCCIDAENLLKSANKS